MNTIKILAISLIALFINNNIAAQTHDHSQHQATKTESFKVAGNCDMCKTRIEKAAKVEGVTKASWDSEKQLLTVMYNPEKIKTDDIQKKVAEVGHDTEKFKADDKVYNKLPSCCKYQRN
ncbi:MAG: cation transporter [Bacteroidales bacterium]|nr:MAG: cation transporter [Bacteroidales bacterium]